MSPDNGSINQLSLEDQTAFLAQAIPSGEGVLTAAVLLPDTEDAQGHSYSAEEVASAERYFMKYRKIGVEHKGRPLSDGVDVLSSRILTAPEQFGDQMLPIGTWIMSVKIDDPKLWAKVESGEINGFSIQGKAIMQVSESEPVHKFASTQFNLPHPMKDMVLKMAAEIPATELHDYGVDHSPHITVKYGIHTDDTQLVRQAVAKGPNKPVSVMLGKTAVFSNPDYDVLHIQVDSPQLRDLNKHISGYLDNSATFNSYKPHVTVAYLKPGEGKKYAGDDRFFGQVHTFNTLIYSNRYGDQSYLDLGQPAK